MASLQPSGSVDEYVAERAILRVRDPAGVAVTYV